MNRLGVRSTPLRSPLSGRHLESRSERRVLRHRRLRRSVTSASCSHAAVEESALDLELAWLRSWLEVVDSGGFAREADRIHPSHTPTSAHVASLGHALGCTLIERRLRPLTLTEEGKRLLPRARSIIAAVDDTISDFRSTQTTVAGRVTIASFVSASSEFLRAYFDPTQFPQPGSR